MQKKTAAASIVSPWWAIFFLTPLLMLAWFAHPAADDFPISHTARDWGSYTTVVGYYKCWSARYTSLFLMSLNPLVFGGFKAYKLGSLLIMSGLYFSLSAFFRNLFPSEQAARQRPLLFLPVFLLSMPDLSGGLYYLGGALFYQPGNMLLALLLASLWAASPPDGLLSLAWKGWGLGLLQGFLLVLLAGCNEIGMMLALVIPALGLLWKWHQEKIASAGWALLLLVSMLCALVILKSPATFYRMEASGSFGRGWPEVAANAWHGMLLSLLHWFSSPALAVFLIFSALIPLPSTERIRAGRGLRLLLTGGSLLLLLVCFLPSYLGEGMLQGRTENSLLFLFLILFFLNLRIWKPFWNTANAYQNAKAWLLPSFILLLPLSPGFRLAVSDLQSGEAAAFSAERDRRDSLMRNTPGDEVEVEAVLHKPKSLFAGDIGDYPDPWYDNHFAELYGKKSVRLKKPEPAFKSESAK